MREIGEAPEVKKLLDQCLWAINFLLYLLWLFMWVVLPGYFTLNIALGIFTLGLSGILLVKNYRAVKNYAASMQFKNISQHTIHCFLVFCILGLVNYLSYKNPAQWDLTTGQGNRLNQQSLEVIKKVTHPLAFKVYSSRQKARTLLPLLELYRLENSRFNVTLIDPATNPLQAKRDGISRYGQVRVEFQGRMATFFEHSEQAITHALLRVLRSKPATLYFARGHRAAALGDEGAQGLSKLKGYLESEGHRVQEIALDKLATIPPRSGALVLWGLKDGPLKVQLAAVREFLHGQGSLLVALDPQVNVRAKLDPLAELRQLIAKERSLFPANDFVVDTRLAVKDSGGSVPVIEKFNSRHPVTEGMVGQVFFPLVASVELAPAAPAAKLSRLAETSAFPASWAEQDFSEVRREKVTFTRGRDLMGPITVMAASESSRGKAVAFGNSTFVHNRYFSFQNNFLLFANAINWLVDQGEFISFDRVQGPAKKLILSAVAMGVVFYFAVVLGPLLLLTLAFLLYRRRVRW